jgi:protein-disulfide isomerase
VCLTEERYAAAVDADTAMAKELGLRGTPTFFFNGERVEGAIPEEAFERVVTSMIR